MTSKTAAPIEKLPAADVVVGDLVREKVWIDQAQGSAFMLCPVVAVDPGPTSVWITLQHPNTGATFRIRPRGTKVLKVQRAPKTAELPEGFDTWAALREYVEDRDHADYGDPTRGELLAAYAAGAPLNACRHCGQTDHVAGDPSTYCAEAAREFERAGALGRELGLEPVHNGVRRIPGTEALWEPTEPTTTGEEL